MHVSLIARERLAHVRHTCGKRTHAEGLTVEGRGEDTALSITDSVSLCHVLHLVDLGGSRPLICTLNLRRAGMPQDKR